MRLLYLFLYYKKYDCRNGFKQSKYAEIEYFLTKGAKNCNLGEEMAITCIKNAKYGICRVKFETLKASPNVF